MAKSGTIIGQITEELGELGKKVVKETVKAPVDIATGAFEKSTAGGVQTGNRNSAKSEKEEMEKTPLDRLDEAKPLHERRTFARKILDWLAAGRKKEPSVYEEKIAEEARKKETTRKQAAAAAFQQLPAIKGRPKPGTLLSRKQAGSETGKNVRGD